MGKIKIVGDGTPHGTTVLLDGRPVPGVSRVEVVVDAGRGTVSGCRLYFDFVDINLDVQLTLDLPAVDLSPK